MVTDGPTRAARTWLCPLVSALRSLCSQRSSCGASFSRVSLKSWLQPGSYSMVVTPQVEWATNTVQSPSENPWLAIAFWA